MGISRRNPRGNFNWQYRMLRRRSTCCGNLNEPLACDNISPILQLITSPWFCKSKTVPANAFITIRNIQGGSPFNENATTLFEWYKGGPGGAFVYSSYGNSTLTIPPASQVVGSSQTYYVVATNQYGCQSAESFTLYFFAQPDMGILTTPGTGSCVPDPGQPCGFLGDATITVTNNNVGPGALYYTYRIKYGASSPNPGCQDVSLNTAATSYVWPVCPGDYTVYISVWGNVNGVPTPVCGASTNVTV